MKITVLDFWAPHCNACRAMAPAFDRLALEHPDVEFRKVNTDDDPEDLGTRFAVMKLPTFVVLNSDGDEEARAGAMPEAAFERWVRSALAEARS